MVNVTINGTTYPYPERGNTAWASAATDAFVALAGSVLYTGGSTGVNFITSATALPATAGFLRLAKTDKIDWRDNANTGNYALGISATDSLQFGGADVAMASDYIPIVNPATVDHVPVLTAGGELVDSGINKTALQGNIFGGLVGWIVPRMSYELPTASFPAHCISNDDTTLDAANWPQLVPYLRAIKAIYNPGIAGMTSDFGVTDWAVATNVGTLTLDTTDAEDAILTALAEDQLEHGSYTAWRSIDVPIGGIGNIPAGEYAITAVDPALRTITFAVTATDGTGSGSFVVNFYPYRIVGSTTTARWYSITGGAVMTGNDVWSIGGYRQRDRTQGHAHFGIAESILTRNAGGENYGTGSEPARGFPFDAGLSNAGYGTPRIGDTTRPRSITGFLYLWGVEYVP